jgi:hypothetical protein
VCFVVRKTISELEHMILTTLFLLVQKTLAESYFNPNPKPNPKKGKRQIDKRTID